MTDALVWNIMGTEVNLYSS